MVLESFVSLHLYIAELPLQYWGKLQHASYVRRTKVIIKLHKGIHFCPLCEVDVKERRFNKKEKNG